MNISNELSIVIPLYNQEITVLDTLESIFSQTRRPAEIIVIDAGSSDAGADKVREIYGDRVRVIHTYRRSVDEIKNLGMRIANCIFVGFADANKRFSPCFLEKLEKRIAGHLQSREGEDPTFTGEFSKEPGNTFLSSFTESCGFHSPQAVAFAH